MEYGRSAAWSGDDYAVTPSERRRGQPEQREARSDPGLLCIQPHMTIPATALRAQNLHLLPWTTQIGSSIAPVAPLLYGIEIDPDDGGLILSASGSDDAGGKAYPGVLFCPGANGASIPQPMLPNTGHMALAFSFSMDPASIANCNVRETDAIPVIAGEHYNGSVQVHQATAEIDVGSWTGTGVTSAAIAPDVEHEAVIQYELSVKTITVVSYTLDGVVSTLPALPQAATASNWLDSVNGSQGAVNIQLQIGLLPSGAPVTIKYKTVDLYFW
jgi:hypothetical protein